MQEQVDADELAHLVRRSWRRGGRPSVVLCIRSARSKCTPMRRRQAMCPRAVARKVLPTPTGSEDEGVAGLVDEAHRHELGPDGLVVGDLGGVVPGLEHHGRVELGRPGPQTGRGGVAALHLVGEQLLEELGVGEVVAAGQRQALGQGGRGAGRASVGASATLSSGETDGRGRAHRPGLLGAWRTRRGRGRSGPGSRPGSGGCRPRCLRGPRSSMRETRLTSTASASRARAAGLLDPLGPPLLDQSQAAGRPGASWSTATACPTGRWRRRRWRRRDRRPCVRSRSMSRVA